MSAVDTVANGNRVRYGEKGRQEVQSFARRVAAAFGRSDSRIEKIRANSAGVASVWIDTEDVENGGEVLSVPDGFNVSNVFVSSTGSVCVRVTEDR